MNETSPLAGGMLTIHKIITRGLNTSIRKCDEYLGKKGIPPGESEGFSMYMKSLKWITHSHHLSEDEIVFPYFKEHLEAPYDRLKDDHDTMAGILGTLDQCISELPSGRVEKLRETLGEFDRLWKPHIKIEEENFTSEKLQAVIGMREQGILLEKLGEHGRKNSGPGPLTLPFVFYNLEGRDRKAFTKDLPWFVKKVLVPIVWKKHWRPMSPFFLNS